MSLVWNCEDESIYMRRAIKFFCIISGKPETSDLRDFDVKTQSAIVQKAQEYKNEQFKK